MANQNPRRNASTTGNKIEIDPILVAMATYYQGVNCWPPEIPMTRPLRTEIARAARLAVKRMSPKQLKSSLKVRAKLVKGRAAARKVARTKKAAGVKKAARAKNAARAKKR
jgi:hypothetical protein